MPAPRMTTDVYLRTPETMMPQELVYGVVREAAAAPTPGHQFLVGEIFFALRAHLAAHPRGRVWMSPIDVVLDRDRNLVLQPDIVVVSPERMHLVTDRIWGAPDLAVEVLSPMPRMGRLDDRIAWFAEYGVRECWVVRQIERDVEVLQLAPAGVVSREKFTPRGRLRSSVLPEFDRSLASILGNA